MGGQRAFSFIRVSSSIPPLDARCSCAAAMGRSWRVRPTQTRKQEKPGTGPGFSFDSRLDRRNHLHDLIGIEIDDANLIADEDVLVTPPFRDDDHDIFGNIEERHIARDRNANPRFDFDIYLGTAEMAFERRLYARALFLVERNMALARFTAAFCGSRTRLATLAASCARGRILVLLGSAVALSAVKVLGSSLRALILVK